MKVHHLAVLVADLAQAETFYTGVLGLTILRRFTDDTGAPRSFWVNLGGTIFLAVELGATTGDVLRLALHIRADEREPWRARLAAAHVAVEKETAYTLYFRDPSGNLLGLSHYPDCAPAPSG